jgi:hypothetical protein
MIYILRFGLKSYLLSTKSQSQTHHKEILCSSWHLGLPHMGILSIESTTRTTLLSFGIINDETKENNLTSSYEKSTKDNNSCMIRKWELLKKKKKKKEKKKKIIFPLGPRENRRKKESQKSYYIIYRERL